MAITTIPSGMRVTSPGTTSIRGCARTFAVTVSLKASRSTARAFPAGTRAASALVTMAAPTLRISACSRPLLCISPSPPRLVLHTSSAKFPVRCAGVIFTGRISNRRTRTPCFAAASAASDPASPAPITVMVGVLSEPLIRGTVYGPGGRGTVYRSGVAPSAAFTRDRPS